MTVESSFFIKTYGCQMNERDSESVQVLLSARGFSASPSEGEAGVILINTCSVRGKAEDKAIGKARLLVAQKKKRPGLRVGLFGCMVQRLKGDLFELIPGLDFAVGPHRLGLLPDVLTSVLAGEGFRLEAGEERGEGDVLRGHRDGATGAFVNILYGCNRRCAYCIVPTVRGGEWSRPAAEIVEDVRRLAAGGVREITLLGQSVMSYGRTNAVWPEGSVSTGGFTEPFSRLLEAVHAAAGGAWIRFTSGHPSGCTAEVARAMGSLPQVCQHLHLPLQSGSDRILARMRRGYDSDAYRQAVARLRAHVPDLVLTTDVIVGFPARRKRILRPAGGWWRKSVSSTPSSLNIHPDRERRPPTGRIRCRPRRKCGATRSFWRISIGRPWCYRPVGWVPNSMFWWKASAGVTPTDGPAGRDIMSRRSFPRSMDYNPETG